MLLCDISLPNSAILASIKQSTEKNTIKIEDLKKCIFRDKLLEVNKISGTEIHWKVNEKGLKSTHHTQLAQ